MLKVFDAWREQRQRRTAYCQLSHATADLLADIGVTHQDIENLRRVRRRNGSMPGW